MGTVDERLKNKKVIFFDGVCSLCNSGVNFVIKNDPKSLFHFAPLSSELFKDISLEKNLPPLDSVVLYDKGKLFYKSRAVLEVAKRLRRGYPLLYSLIIVPPFIRNFIYDYLASRRYKWFGKLESCRLPTKEESLRFLE